MKVIYLVAVAVALCIGAANVYGFVSPEQAEVAALPAIRKAYPSDAEGLVPPLVQILQQGFVSGAPVCNEERRQTGEYCREAPKVSTTSFSPSNHQLNEITDGDIVLRGGSREGFTFDIAQSQVGPMSLSLPPPKVVDASDKAAERSYLCQSADNDAAYETKSIGADGLIQFKVRCRVFIDQTWVGSLEYIMLVGGLFDPIVVNATFRWPAFPTDFEAIKLVVPVLFPAQIMSQVCASPGSSEGAPNHKPVEFCQSVLPQNMDAVQSKLKSAENQRASEGGDKTGASSWKDMASRIRRVTWIVEELEHFTVIRDSSPALSDIRLSSSSPGMLEYVVECEKEKECHLSLEHIFSKQNNYGIDSEVRMLAALTKSIPAAKKYVSLVQNYLTKKRFLNFPLTGYHLLFAMGFVRPSPVELESILDVLEATSVSSDGWLCSPNVLARRIICHFTVHHALLRIISSLNPESSTDIALEKKLSQLLQRGAFTIHRLISNRMNSTRWPTGSAEILQVCRSMASVIAAEEAGCRGCREFLNPPLKGIAATVCPVKEFQADLDYSSSVEAEFVEIHYSQYRAAALGRRSCPGYESNDGVPFALRDPKSITSKTASQVLPYAQFMTERMQRPLTINGKQFTAFTETEKAIEGDDWMWTDDNAKSLEMLVLPGVYEKVSDVADKVLGFCLETMRTDFILRRVALDPADANKGRFRVESETCNHFRFHNGLMNFKGNPTSIVQSYRFHDGRDVDAVIHKGPILEIELDDGKSIVEDLSNPVYSTEGSVCSFDSKPELSVLEMSVGGTISVDGAAILDYKYIFLANASRTPSRQLLSLDPPTGTGAKVKAVKVTFVHEVGSGDTVLMSRFCGSIQGKVSCAAVSPGDHEVWPSTSPGVKVPIWHAALQGGNAGFSYGSYSYLHSFDKYTHSSYYAEPWSTSGRLRKVRTHYLCRSLPCKLEESKLMTAGGLHDEIERYDAIMTSIARGEDQGMIDYSISYDIGAELNALTAFYLFASKDAYTMKPTVNLKALKETIDRHLKVYFSVFGRYDHHGDLPNVFARGLGFVTLAANTMLCATGEVQYLEMVETTIEMIVNSLLPDRPFVMRCVGGEPWSSIDCEAGVFLALSRVLATFPFGLSSSPYLTPEILAKLVRVVGPEMFRPGQQAPDTPQIVMARWEADDFRWGFKCGIMLRAVSVFRLAQQRYPALRGLHLTSEVEANFVATKTACDTYLTESTTIHKDGRMEIRTSKASTETNTESQPWMVIGKFGDDLESVFQAWLRQSWSVHAKANRLSQFIQVPFCIPGSGNAETVLSRYQLHRADLQSLKEAESKNRKSSAPSKISDRIQSQLSSRVAEEDPAPLGIANNYLYLSALGSIPFLFFVLWRMGKRHGKRGALSDFRRRTPVP